MSIDEQVRAALHHRAERIEPGHGSWERIQERVDDGRRRRRRAWIGGATGAVAAALVLVVAMASLGGGDRAVETGPAGPSGSGPVVTHGPPSAGDDLPGVDDILLGIWPIETPDQLLTVLGQDRSGYDDPVEVARAFAVEYLGMVDPAVDEIREGPQALLGDTLPPPGVESALVEVQPRGESGEPSTARGTRVVLAQLNGDGPWNVVSADSENIEVAYQYPMALFGKPSGLFAGLSSPLTISGRSRAFEGTLQIEVREAGMEAGEALGRSVVSGGAGPELGSFLGSISFDPPSASEGAVVLSIQSAVDGSTMEAKVIDVAFRHGSEAPKMTIPSQTEVTAYFHRGEELVPVTRYVPATPGVLRASLDALVAGPTDEEQADGLQSWFSAKTAGMLKEVTVDAAGAAVVDFGDLRPLVPNASTSAGSERLLDQLNATVFRFPSVSSVKYRIEGSCDAFFEWLQRGCQVVERPGG